MNSYKFVPPVHSDDFAILCGSERPGYYIDITTGQIIGKDFHTETLTRWGGTLLFSHAAVGLSFIWQTSTSAGKFQESVRMECASTWSAASGASAPLASSTTTSCWFVKVTFAVCCRIPVFYFGLFIFMPAVWTSLSLLLSDIDECQNGPVCQQNADCLNLPGSYRCECKAGYRFTPTGQCLGKDVLVIS